MEGVPRMPMLSVEPKICVAPAEFSLKFKEHIVRHYQEDPDKYDKAIEELDNLRETACTKANVDISGCKVLKKYFAQLHMMKTRFPMELGDECAVAFSWLDKFFDMPNPVTIEDVGYEMACIMHNIGSLHSSVGAVDTRMSAECAAWAFQYLRDKMSAGNFSVDFDKTLLGWYSTLMLAQAQECILEKSMVDNRKNSIVAKVSMQIAEYYRQCLGLLDSGGISELVGSSKSKTWKKFCQMKENYYCGIAYLYMGQAADEQQKMGERLAWYQEAGKRLEEANKLALKEGSTIKDPLKFTTDVITVKKDNALKENDFIYHDKVASLDKLPEIKGVALVKGIEFNPLDPEISGPDIFGALVPLSVHQSNSLYSEEKAKLLRSIAERVSEKDKELEIFMNSLQLDRLSLSKEFSELPIPEALLERSAAFNYEVDPVPRLMDSLQRVTGCYQEADGKLLDLEQRLNDSEKEIRGVQGKVVGSGVESLFGGVVAGLDELTPELGRYTQAHQHATQTNTDLQKAVAAHSENLKILALPLSELKKSLPAPSVQPHNAPEREELKKVLEKVEEMKNQRQLLVQQLRDQIHKDDLTRVILSEKDTHPQEMFEKELKKHDEKVGILDQNLTAQANILKALTQANAKYAELRKETNEAAKARDSKMMGLIAAFDTYKDVKEKSEKGRQFYEKLLGGLSELEERVEGLEEEWKTLKDTMKRHFREEEERRAREEAVAATPLPAPTHVPAVAPGGGAERPKGERLKDYLEYYRAKKSGANPPPPNHQEYGAGLNQQNVAPPVSSGAYIPPGAFQQNLQNGTSIPAPVSPPMAQPQSYISAQVGMNGYPNVSIPQTLPSSTINQSQPHAGYGTNNPPPPFHYNDKSHNGIPAAHQTVPSTGFQQPQMGVSLQPSAGHQQSLPMQYAGTGQRFPASSTQSTTPYIVQGSPVAQRVAQPAGIRMGAAPGQQNYPAYHSVSQQAYYNPTMGTVAPTPSIPPVSRYQTPQGGGIRGVPHNSYPVPAPNPRPSVPQQQIYAQNNAYNPVHGVAQHPAPAARPVQPFYPPPQQQQTYAYNTGVQQPQQHPNVVGYQQQHVTLQTPRTYQAFAGIDTPVEGAGMSLPAPLQPQKASQNPPVKELTQTEKELADVFG